MPVSALLIASLVACGKGWPGMCPKSGEWDATAPGALEVSPSWVVKSSALIYGDQRGGEDDWAG